MKHLAEHKELSEDEKILLAKCSRVIKQIEPEAEVILYGSRARGDGDPESDYDLLILVDGEVTLERENFLCRQLYSVGLETGTALSPLVYSRQEWKTSLHSAMPFHVDVEKDGVIV